MSAIQLTSGRTVRKPRHITAHIVLAALMIYFLVPFWWVIVNSSKDSAGLFGGANALWFAPNINWIENFQQLFTYSGGIYGR